MKSGSWSSYQSALPPEARSCGERDDEPEPVGRHDHEPPAYVVVEWFAPFEWIEAAIMTNHFFGCDEVVAVRHRDMAPVSRWFPAERWAWKHAQAWQKAMVKRHGHATIEEVF